MQPDRKLHPRRSPTVSDRLSQRQEALPRPPAGIPPAVTALGLPKRLNGLATVQPTSRSPSHTDTAIDWASFGEELATAPLGGNDAFLVGRVRRTIEELVAPDEGSTGNLISIVEALLCDPAASALQAALIHVRGEAKVTTALRDLLAVTIHREALADALHATGIPRRIQ